MANDKHQKYIKDGVRKRYGGLITLNTTQYPNTLRSWSGCCGDNNDSFPNELIDRMTGVIASVRVRAVRL